MRSFDERYEILHMTFDINVHKKTFIDYLEVIIDVDGIVHYAVPSHTEWLSQKAMKEMNISRAELYDKIERYEQHNGYRTYGVESLCEMLNCVSIWTNCYSGKPNDKQKETLKMLYNEGLYRGPMDK